YFTDTHPDYHRPTDDPHLINYQGQRRVLAHVRRVVEQLDSLSNGSLAFREMPAEEQQQQVILQGVTLGVTPDYGYQGNGMRITGVTAGGPADQAGVQPGDVIIALDGTPTGDIYRYMEVLNTLEEGDTTTVTIQREGNKTTLDIRFCPPSLARISHQEICSSARRSGHIRPEVLSWTLSRVFPLQRR
ncbi:MAG: PDZ domain-containing protein, partial [Balneolaceae bacterium]|nr:PDZ domain-containing protein [Balneolaceae bacterium]